MAGVLEDQQMTDLFTLTQYLTQATAALREGHAQLHAEHRALCRCLHDSGLVFGWELREQIVIRRTTLHLRSIMTNNRIMSRIGAFSGLQAIGRLNNCFAEYSQAEGRSIPICSRSLLKRMKKKTDSKSALGSESEEERNQILERKKALLRKKRSTTPNLPLTSRSATEEKRVTVAEEKQVTDSSSRTPSPGRNNKMWTKVKMVAAVGGARAFGAVPTLSPKHQSNDVDFGALSATSSKPQSEVGDESQQNGESVEGEESSAPKKVKSRSPSPNRTKSASPKSKPATPGPSKAKENNRGRNPQLSLAMKMHRQCLLESRIYGAGGSEIFTWNDIAKSPMLAPVLCRAFGISLSCRLSATSRTLKQFLNGALCSLSSNTMPEVFVIGGHVDTTRNPVATTDTYNPTTNRWERIQSSMHYARTGCTAVTAKGSIYAIGGHDGRKNLATVERFDLAARKWFTRQELPKMTAPRYQCPAASLDGSIYVCDGLQEPSSQSSSSRSGFHRFESFAVNDRAWQPLDTLLPESQKIHALVVVRSRIYMFSLDPAAQPSEKEAGSVKAKADPTPENEDDALELNCEYFDPSEAQSTFGAIHCTSLKPKQDPPFSKLRGAACFRDRVYLFGEQLKQVCVLRAAEGIWEELQVSSQLPLRMRTVKTMGSDGQGAQLLCLGQFTDKDTSDSRRKSLESRWMLMPPYQAARAGCGIALVRTWPWLS